MDKTIKNNSDRSREELREIEAKFSRISKVLADEYPDEPVILYTVDGLIIRGKPLDLLGLYAEADNHAQEELNEIKEKAGSALLDRILNGGQKHDCGNPNCKAHEAQRNG